MPQPVEIGLGHCLLEALMSGHTPWKDLKRKRIMNLSESNELPPEIQEELDRMNADPNYGTRRERPQRKTERPESWPQVERGGKRGSLAGQDLGEAYESASLEEPDSEEESLPNRHWLLITGIGIVAIGLILRWLLKRR